MSDPQDGFDLLEYPCDFQFKAMVKVNGLADEQSASDAMQACLEETTQAPEVIAVSSKPSKTGKFESVSLTLRLQNRIQLEAIYEQLANHPNVVMTL